MAISKFKRLSRESGTLSNVLGRWPEENVYNSYIEALCRCEKFEEAVEAFKMMESSDNRVDLKANPTDKTYRSIVTLLIGAKRVDLIEVVDAHSKTLGLDLKRMADCM